MCSNIYINDYGTNFIITIYDESSGIVDLSSATSLLFNFVKPDSTLITKTGSLYTDGTDGIVQYTTVSGDLDTAGNWRLQVLTTFSSSQLHSNIYNFKVYNNIG